MLRQLATYFPALLVVLFGFTACGGGPSASLPSAQVLQATPAPALTGIKRTAFVGAFFSPEGTPPFGVFDPQSPGTAPQPYPSTGATLDGPTGYCSAIAPNGFSIVTGNVVATTSLANIVNLGVRWTRMGAPQFFDDLTHVFGPGHYGFADLDAAECRTLADNGIRPIIGLAAGPVQYSATLGQLPAQSYPQYRTAADFAQWCGTVATHEKQAFPSVSQFSLPGNEVNTNPQLFPGGAAQIAAYSQACYAAIKAANAAAFVYAFELNMDGQANATAFVAQMYALGCKVGTCYDGISMHLSLRYPIPALSVPCYPNTGGDYSMQCITDIQSAAHAPVHVLISETNYPIPSAVPDAATQALAVVAAFTAFAGNASVDGVSYADVDQCGLYIGTIFANGCLITTAGQIRPAYTALAALARSNFF